MAQRLVGSVREGPVAPVKLYVDGALWATVAPEDAQFLEGVLKTNAFEGRDVFHPAVRQRIFAEALGPEGLTLCESGPEELVCRASAAEIPAKVVEESAVSVTEKQVQELWDRVEQLQREVLELRGLVNLRSAAGASLSSDSGGSV